MLQFWFSKAMRSKAWCGVVAIALTIGMTETAIGQIVPDETLGGERSRLNAAGDRIEGGAQRGQNLFHSFREFNVGTGQQVYFANPADVRNIFSRVTGTNISNIDGVLGVDGSANLFLMNPNGIVFGQNARLDVGGSFVGTTANAIGFGDRGWFSATSPEGASPLLTVSPSAFLFNQLPTGNIDVNSNTPSASGSSFLGLRVPNGQNLLLLGGNVSVDSGQLNAFGGRVEIGAVAGSGAIGLNADDSFSFPVTTVRANVLFTNQAKIDVTLGNGGDIGIIAGNIDVLGSSRLLAGIDSGFGALGNQAGNLTLDGTNRIQIGETSGVGNIVNPDAIGNGGDLNITTGSLFVTGGSQLGSITYGQGNAGNVIIRASDRVSLDGTSADGQFLSSAFSTTEQRSVGQGGNIDISTRFLSVTNGAQLDASTNGQGNSGNVIIRATDRISFDGRSANGQVSSKVRSTVKQEGSGHGGNVDISTGFLSVTNGAQLQSGTSGQGDAGNVIIRADRTFFDHGVAFSAVEESGIGQGGNIDISTESLSLTNGAQLQSSTSGRGNAGDVIIRASDRAFFDGSNTAAFSRVEREGVGRGGNVEIATSSLSVTNGAGLTASTFGQGDAGSVIIHARDRVSFNGISANEQFSGATSNVEQEGVGQGGSIDIFTNSLSVTNGARLQTSTFGQGNAGNIIIRASDHVSFDSTNVNELIFSGAFSTVQQDGVGQGGNIDISTRTLSVTNGAELQASTLGRGNAGNIIILASDRISFDGTSANGQVASGAFSGIEERGIGQGGKLNITTNSLTVENGARLLTSTLGQGNAGNITINARDAVSFNGVGRNGFTSGAFSTVETGAVGRGGIVSVTTNSLSVIDGARLEAATLGQGNAGDVSITAHRSAFFDGVSSNGLSSGIFNEVTSEAVGNAGTITLNTGSLSVTNGARLSTSIYGQGNAGSILVQAKGSVFLSNDSYISSLVRAGGRGNGGDIDIQSRLLTLTNGAQLQSAFFRTDGGLPGGRGERGGNIRVNASDSVILTGVNAATGSSSGLLSLTERGAVGRSGNITVNTHIFRVLDSAIVDSETKNQSNSGNIRINATMFEATRGGQIVAGTSSSGRAGSININAGQRITLSGSDPNYARRLTQFGQDLILGFAASGLYVNGNASSTGNSGTINLQTNSLTLNDGAQISAATSGTGNAGGINIRTQQLNVRGNTQIAINSQGTGEAGSLNLIANSVSLDRGNITAETVSSQGGNIRLHDLETLQANHGNISASTRSGQGGDLRVDSNAVVLNNSTLAVAATDRGGQAGNLTVTANDMRLNRSRLTAQTRSTEGNGANIRLQDIDRLLYLQNGSRISARAFDNADGGNVTINADNGFVVARTGANQNNDIIARANRGNGGQVSITAQGILGLEQRPSTPVNTTNDIDVSSDQGLQGTVTLNLPNTDPSRGLTELPTTPIDASTQLSQTCPTNTQEADRLGEFIVSGRGGLPPNPIDLLSDDNVLTDWVTSNAEPQNPAVELPIAEPRNAIVEAQGWKRGDNGEIQLVAETPASSPLGSTQCR